jgi:hypothetical protein
MGFSRRLTTSVALVAMIFSMLQIPVAASIPNFMLNNEKIRFGGGGSGSTTYSYTDSIANSGLPEQPHYKSSDGNWYKLTYADIPLSMTLGSGTGGTNWSGAIIPTSGSFNSSMGLNTLSSLAVDVADTVSRTPAKAVSYGYGKVIVSGAVNLNSANIGVRHMYELGQNDSYVKVTSTITNNHASTVNNLMIWVGTRDDWVGNSDGPKKERGNIINGEFVKISNQVNDSSAIRITTASEGILFYSTTPQTKTAIDSCCSFENAYDRNPTESPIELTGDGSYAISLPVGNLASSASTSITWFYAAGQIADLAEVVRNVASASAPAAPAVASGDASVTASWSAPASADPIVGYRVRYSTNNGSTWTVHNTDFNTSTLSRTISGLTNGTQYIFQVAALTGDLNNSPTLGTWSASSVPTMPGGANAPTIGSIVAGNSKLTVAFTAPTDNGGTSITDYEYSTDNGANWLSAGTTTSPVVISGLTNGTTYQVKLRAKGLISGIPSSAVTGTPQATVATAPTINSIDSSDTELVVSFSPPLDSGGSSITNYKYSTDGVNYRLLSPSRTSSPISISKLSTDGTTSLSNGTSYQITLKAVNSIGDSAASNSASATPLASQSVSWIPEKTSFSAAELPSFTPFPLAATDGPGTIVYSIANAGTTECTINASTGMVTFSKSGVCKVRATSQATATHKAGTFEVDFTLERIVAVATPTSTPTPTPTPTRTPRVIRVTPTPTPTLSPQPSVSPSPTVAPNTPIAVPQETIDRVASQLGVKFTEQGLPELKPLQSIGLVDGVPIPVTLTPNQTNTGLVVDGDGFTITLKASNDNGEESNLTSDGKLILSTSNLATFSGTGFAANSNVVIWLFSDPSELGTVITDSNGSFEGSLPLPSQISVGEHTVQLNGTTGSGESRSVAVGVVVADDAEQAGSSPPFILWIFGIALGVFIFWIILLRRRKSEED